MDFQLFASDKIKLISQKVRVHEGDPAFIAYWPRLRALRLCFVAGIERITQNPLKNFEEIFPYKAILPYLEVT